MHFSLFCNKKENEHICMLLYKIDHTIVSDCQSVALSSKLTIDDVMTCVIIFILIACVFIFQYCIISSFTLSNRTKNIPPNKVCLKTDIIY